MALSSVEAVDVDIFQVQARVLFLRQLHVGDIQVWQLSTGLDVIVLQSVELMLMFCGAGEASG